MRPPDDKEAPAGVEYGGRRDNGRADEATTAVCSDGTPSELLAAALSYAADGRAVFLLSADLSPYANCSTCWRTCQTPEAKATCDHLLCHGFYAATTDPARIRALVAAQPDSGLAVRTGAVSGLVVLDVDVKDGRQGRHWLMELVGSIGPELLATRAARTVSGGWHLWLRHPGGGLVVRNSTNRHAGLDLRGDGGYVVVPPSRLEDGRGYEWATARDRPLRAMTPELPELVRSLAAPSRRPRRPGSTDTGSLARLCGAIRRAGEGERNSLLHWASCRAGEGAELGDWSEIDAEAALVSAAQDAGLPRREAERTVRSGLGRRGSE